MRPGLRHRPRWGKLQLSNSKDTIAGFSGPLRGTGKAGWRGENGKGKRRKGTESKRIEEKEKERKEEEKKGLDFTSPCKKFCGRPCTHPPGAKSGQHCLIAYMFKMPQLISMILHINSSVLFRIRLSTSFLPIMQNNVRHLVKENQ